MSKDSYNSIRNGVITSVIAGVILLTVPVLREYFLFFIAWLWSGVVWCWLAITSSYSLPGWVLLIIILFATIGVIFLYFSIKIDNTPEYKSYIEDYIYNVKWRWSWFGNNISNPWCFCPSCDATLVYNDSSVRDYYADPKTDFICENCNTTVATIKGGDKEYAISAVKREIDRRVRTNQYKKH